MRCVLKTTDHLFGQVLPFAWIHTFRLQTVLLLSLCELPRNRYAIFFVGGFRKLPGSHFVCLALPCCQHCLQLHLGLVSAALRALKSRYTLTAPPRMFRFVDLCAAWYQIALLDFLHRFGPIFQQKRTNCFERSSVMDRWSVSDRRHWRAAIC